MGEIVDLELYRKQHKRRVSDSEIAKGRRGRDGAGVGDQPPGPAIGISETGRAKPSRAKPDGAAKIDRNDQNSD